MTGAGYLLPPTIALPLPTTHWPVWSGSITAPIRFAPMPKKAAVKLWHRARDFDRQTKRQGKHGGALGHAALQVLHSLIFDFMNFRTGRLDPGYAAIARAANVCERTVGSALRRLKEAGVLAWVRRCAESVRDGRYVREQETNAYAIQPETAWHGYTAPPAPPPPPSDAWGACPPLPDVLTQAATERALGAAPAAMLGILADDRDNLLARALASFGRRIAAKSEDFPGR